MPELSDLLHERETRGLRGALTARVVVALAFVGLLLLVHGTLLELALSVTLCLTAALAGWVLLKLLARGAPLTPIGLAGTAIDLTVLGLSPLIWLHSVGGPEDMPWSFTIKGGITSVMIFVIACGA